MSSIREALEQRELETLAPQAAKSSQSRGRLTSEPEDDVRPAFQHDRDRIIHSKAFRRLKHKTQVFFAPTGDHYRTRLTHTLEVSQIARTIAKVLNLHEELTEAISLAHDLGHTPFGHAGERVLSDLMPGGFNHYEQSLRIVDRLENDGLGLNLTWEVRDGIAKHSKGKSGSPVGMAQTVRASTGSRPTSRATSCNTVASTAAACGTTTVQQSSRPRLERTARGTMPDRAPSRPLQAMPYDVSPRTEDRQPSGWKTVVAKTGPLEPEGVITPEAERARVGPSTQDAQLRVQAELRLAVRADARGMPRWIEDHVDRHVVLSQR